MYQTTLQKSIHCSGIGLHKGEKASITLSPAQADSGILFRIPAADGIHNVRPAPEKVLATELATTLGDAHATVSTVEHLLATIRGLSIDNIIISVEGGEVPIMDGSALAFVRLFQQAGIKELSSPRRVLAVKRELSFQEGSKQIRATPYAGFRVDCIIDFPHPVIGRERLVIDITQKSFQEIAPARTFGFLKDVQYMRSHGLARGGSLENAVVLDEHGILNPQGLRFPDEFVRHKLLDFIGDMANLPLPIRGNFELVCSGHQFNNQFLRAMEKADVLKEVQESALIAHNMFLRDHNELTLPKTHYLDSLPISA